MATQLTDLPPELLARIIEHAAFSDKMQLSTTNSSFRALLAPALFQCIKVTSDEACTGPIRALVEKYGEHIRHIYFEGHASPEEDEASDLEPTDEPLTEGFYKEDESDESKVPRWKQEGRALPEAVAELLSGEHLPHFNEMTVRFAYDFESEAWIDATDYLGAFGEFKDWEDNRNVETAESEHRWRALMAEVWTAVTGNESVTKLSIDPLLPRLTSTFATPEWSDFLGQLDVLELSMWGGDNGAGWHCNTLDGYLSFISSLDGYFFDHLSKVSRLRLAGAEEAPIGLQGMRHVELPLRMSVMPDLKTLELENIFVGPELSQFLTGHSKTLRQLVLKDCHASPNTLNMNSLAESGITWASFFKKLYQCQPVLDKVVVENDNIALTADEQFGNRGEEDGEPEEIEAVRKQLETGKRRLFAYTYLDDKYGMVFACEEENVAAFQRGDDQRDYDKLMQTVEENARQFALR